MLILVSADPANVYGCAVGAPASTVRALKLRMAIALGLERLGVVQNPAQELPEAFPFIDGKTIEQLVLHAAENLWHDLDGPPAFIRYFKIDNAPVFR